MGKTLYLECASGISGDMVVAALLDLGADEQALRDTLATLPLSGYEVRVGDVVKSGVRARDFDVVLGEGLENHDHDMAWLYGHLAGGEAGHRQAHGHAEGSTHAHPHDGEPAHAHAHHHAHRGLAEVLEIVDAGDLTPRARATAHRVFEVLAQAEATAHGTTPDKVHFHEVGAVDSIVDVVSAAVCLDLLDVTDVIVPKLCEGSGTVRCAHGILPVPVPAVCATVRRHGIALQVLPVQGELVTPTGAAIVAAVRTREALPQAMRILATGVGAGKRDNPGTSGILRAHLIEDAGNPLPHTDGADDRDGVWKLECDVDDCTGEALGHCMGSLLDAGAKEAHFVPVYTKKNRPAWQIQVICDEGRRKACEEVLFGDTTTIGVRRSWMGRTVLERQACEVATPLGPVRAKTVVLPDGTERTWPEHDSVAELARANRVDYQRALRAALASMPPESPCGQA